MTAPLSENVDRPVALRVASRWGDEKLCAVLKRTFDFTFSLLGVILLSPFILLIAALIKTTSPGPVFYRGWRVGQLGKEFQIYKFRTMVLNADKIGGSSTPEDDPRVTTVGKFLRRYKLDELPQLFNVIKGEMSLVGPRPQVPWAVELYTPEEKALLDVRPGMTDYASIRFSNEAEILLGSTDPDKDYLERIAPEKIRLGLQYVENPSFWIDCKIIAATFWALAGGDPERILHIVRRSKSSFSNTSMMQGGVENHERSETVKN